MVKDLIMVGNKTKPNIHFNYEKGELNIEGRCILEYAEIVFEPMSEWLEEYFENSNKKTIINLSLEYFNSSTAKALVRFLLLAKEKSNKVSDLTVNYYYDDENVYEYGQDFQEVSGITFNFIEKNFHP